MLPGAGACSILATAAGQADPAKGARHRRRLRSRRHLGQSANDLAVRTPDSAGHSYQSNTITPGTHVLEMW